MTCNSLKRQGVYQNGIYALKDESDNFPHVSFCDFQGRAGYNLPDMETLIGYLDVTSEIGGVIFSVVRENLSATEAVTGTITFNKVVSNVGNHFTPSSGIFKAPKNGLYSFWLSATTYARADTHVDVLVNGKVWSQMHAHIADDHKVGVNHSFQLRLKPNDVVQLQVSVGSLYISGEPTLIIFSGQLDFEEF